MLQSAGHVGNVIRSQHEGISDMRNSGRDRAVGAIILVDPVDQGGLRRGTGGGETGTQDCGSAVARLSSCSLSFSSENESSLPGMHDRKVSRTGSTCGRRQSWIGQKRKARLKVTNEESGEGG